MSVDQSVEFVRFSLTFTVCIQRQKIFFFVFCFLISWWAGRNESWMNCYRIVFIWMILICRLPYSSILLISYCFFRFFFFFFWDFLLGCPKLKYIFFWLWGIFWMQVLMWNECFESFFFRLLLCWAGEKLFDNKVSFIFFLFVHFL